MIRATPDPRGYEVFLPRAVRPAQLHRVRRVSQVTGCRYLPDSHGTRPCSCEVCLLRGSYEAARLRTCYPRESPAPGKPQLMAALCAAEGPQQIVDALWGLACAGRRWGGAQELAYLADHPDPDVREALAEALWSYRGRAAGELLARFQDDPIEDVRQAASP